jgi:hypothetical protein
MRRMIASSVAVFTLLAGGVVTASSSGAASTASPAVSTQSATCSNAYLDGDSRLGPAQLPTTGPLSVLVHGYHPLAGLSESQFISMYWDPTANAGQGGWRYPPDGGYLLSRGQPVEYQIPLGVGQNIDRFGSPFGAFLSPVGTLYTQRSLPPMNLDNVDVAFTCNYHEYHVVKSFVVESGPIAPAFGQLGYGRQYQLVGSLVPGAPANLNVQWLLDNGYLVSLN